MSKYRILLLLACLLVAFSGYCTELGNLVQNAYGESSSTTQPTTSTRVDQQKNSNGSGDSSITWTTFWTAVTALATVVIGIFTAWVWNEARQTRREGRDSTTLRQQQQSLREDFSRLREKFLEVREGTMNEELYRELLAVAEKANVTFPKHIRSLIMELSHDAWDFHKLDSKTRDCDEEKLHGKLQDRVSNKLLEIMYTIDKHLQTQIDSKEQTLWTQIKKIATSLLSNRRSVS